MILVEKQVKVEAEGLMDYTQADRFSAEDFEKNIERNLRHAREAYQQSQALYTATLNDRVREQYAKALDDPSRVPWFDERAGVWELSAKFQVEDNDAPDFEYARDAHPFLNRIL